MNIWPDSFVFVGKDHPEGIEHSADAVAGRAEAIAALLTARGVAPGDRVAVWMTDGADLVATVFGCWLAGAAFSVIPSFAGRSNSERSKSRVDEVLDVLQPALLLLSAGGEPPEALAGKVATATIPGGAAGSAAEVAQRLATRPDDDVAFVQFTSGSTGGAKGAVVRFGQLKANLAAIAQRTEMSSGDRMVSWAPLYHDMGLMAVLLPLTCGAGLTLMDTDHFVRRPTAWLEAMSRFRRD